MRDAETLRARFEEAFWVEDQRYYAMALDADKHQADAIGSNAGQCLWSGIVSPGRARDVADRLLSPAMFSGWGIRTYAQGQPGFNPFGYHTGTVWPHDTSLAAAGLKRYGFQDEANRLVGQVFEAAQHFGEFRLPELFCGFDREKAPMPVPYPVACSPQAWSAGAAFMFLQTMLGLRGPRRGERARAAPTEPARLARQGHRHEPPDRRGVGRPALPSLARHDERRGPAQGRRPVRDDQALSLAVATVGELLSGAVARLREAGSESAAARRRGPPGLRDRGGADDAPRPSGAARRGRALRRGSRRLWRGGRAGEPVAYIRGIKEFFGLAFAADGRALIPRPETERLVEAGRSAVMARLGAPGRGRDPAPVRIVDVGTGSGAIIVASPWSCGAGRSNLATDVTLVATDASPDALELARENAVGHAVADVIEFVEADLLPPAPPDGGGPIDVVLANLPYVRSDAIAGLPIAASFEPVIALDGGPDGLDVIRRLLGLLPDALADDGVALLEIGADQGSAAPAAVEEILPGLDGDGRDRPRGASAGPARDARGDDAPGDDGRRGATLPAADAARRSRSGSSRSTSTARSSATISCFASGRRRRSGPRSSAGSRSRSSRAGWRRAPCGSPASSASATRSSATRAR